MKKLYTYLLCALLALTLTACSSAPAPQESSSAQNTSSISGTAGTEASSSQASSAEASSDAFSENESSSSSEAPSSEEADKPSKASSKTSSSSKSSSASSKTDKPSSSQKPASKPVSSKPVSSAPSKPSVPSKPSSSTPSSKPPVSSKPQETYKPDDLRVQHILNLVNLERVKVGAPLMSLNKELCKNADVRAVESAKSFSHTRPDGRGFQTAVTVPWNYVGENIAWGQKTPDAVMEAWMKSEGHRKNILNPSYTTLGVGIYEKDNIIYWSQLFVG